MFSFPEKPKTRAINFDDTKLAAQFQKPTKFSLAAPIQGFHLSEFTARAMSLLL